MTTVAIPFRLGGFAPLRITTTVGIVIEQATRGVKTIREVLTRRQSLNYRQVALPPLMLDIYFTSWQTGIDVLIVTCLKGKAFFIRVNQKSSLAPHDAVRCRRMEAGGVQAKVFYYF